MNELSEIGNRLKGIELTLDDISSCTSDAASQSSSTDSNIMDLDNKLDGIIELLENIIDNQR